MLPFFVQVNGAIAKRLCTGLQIRLAQFDSGSRLQISSFEINNLAPQGAFCLCFDTLRPSVVEGQKKDKGRVPVPVIASSRLRCLQCCASCSYWVVGILTSKSCLS